MFQAARVQGKQTGHGRSIRLGAFRVFGGPESSSSCSVMAQAFAAAAKGWVPNAASESQRFIPWNGTSPHFGGNVHFGLGNYP